MKKKNQAVVSMIAAVCMALALSACQGKDTETPLESSIQVQDNSSETNETDGNDDSQTENTTAENPTGAYKDGSTPSYSGQKVKLTIDSGEVVIAMYDNTAVDAFLERLPLTDLSFSDLSGIEKPAEAPEEPFSIEEETPGYDPVTGEMVIYRPRGNFTIFYGDFRYSDELVPLGKVESGLELLAGQEDDFTGTLEIME